MGRITNVGCLTNVPGSKSRSRLAEGGESFVLRTKSEHAKRTNDGATPRAHPCLPRERTSLLVRAEEVVVSRVRLELGLPHRAGGGGSSSSIGVQSLDEGDFGKELAARGPLLISD